MTWHYNEQDTIFAPASATGLAAIGVVRVSGPDAARVMGRLCRLPPPREARVRAIRKASGEVIDRGMVLWLPGPGSFTGEDGGEFHVHGGRAVLEGVAEALVEAGARPAEPGEFSRRAFLNGRMDLLQAEAVADLVEAETEGQRRQALRQMEGALGAVYRAWADRLLRLVAGQEALIDFPDEDLPADVEAETIANINELRAEIEAHLADGRRGERLREGLVFAVVGPVNAGKSTLVNALAGRDAAITSPVPGTTRDVLEVRVALGGVPVTLLDTAGLRETQDPVEAEGVRRARARAEQADAVLHVSDGLVDAPRGTGMMVLIDTKIDTGRPRRAGAMGVSAATGEGMDALRDHLALCAATLTEQAGPPPLTRPRHRAALREAGERLSAAAQAPLPELRAEDLRLALRALGRVTGAVGVEDLLDSLFRQFCIGK